ncbi:MAG: hypothetical protein ACKOC5_00445 [Chloroflexota bacterium]
MRKRVLVFGLWLAGILFPAAWLGRYSAAYRGIFNWLFRPEWMHIAMHLLLYAVLGILLARGFKDRPARQALLLGAACALAVGAAQETLQWTSQGIAPWRAAALPASLFDVGIDLTGVLAGMGSVRLWDQLPANSRPS